MYITEMYSSFPDAHLCQIITRHSLHPPDIYKVALILVIVDILHLNKLIYMYVSPPNPSGAKRFPCIRRTLHLPPKVSLIIARGI